MAFKTNDKGWVFWKTLKSEMVIRQNHLQAKRAINRAINRMKRDKASMIISIEGYELEPPTFDHTAKEVQMAS
jgi:hypothetical protein